jgi:hypothetical protein
LRFAWHLTTVVWAGVAVLLLAVAGAGPQAVSTTTVGAVVTGTAIASAVVTFVGSRSRHPAWFVFLAIAALSWAGTRASG